MSEQAKQIQSKGDSWSTRVLITIFICTLAANIIRDSGLMAYPFALFLTYFLVLLVGYWIKPKPPFRYRQFALRLFCYLLLILAGFWAIPELLSKWIWRPLAYAIPVFLLMLLIDRLPPLYPSNRQPQRRWVSILVAAAFAILFGWASLNSDLW